MEGVSSNKLNSGSAGYQPLVTGNQQPLQYSSLDIDIEDDAKEEEEADETPFNIMSIKSTIIGSKRTLLWVMIASLFVLLCSFKAGEANAGRASVLKASSGTCKPCTFLQCERTLCDPLITPMVCTEGAAHDGCANTAMAWLGGYVCEDCCDSSQCKSTLKDPPTNAEDEMPFECKPCTQKECEANTCASPSAFACLGGGATGGCAETEFHWPLSLNNICTSCCDAANC